MEQSGPDMGQNIGYKGFMDFVDWVGTLWNDVHEIGMNRYSSLIDYAKYSNCLLN